MRRAVWIGLLSLGVGSALAGDLSGTYALRGLAGFRTLRVELELLRVGPDRYRATRRTWQGSRKHTLLGEALFSEERLRLRLDAPAGAAGRLLSRESRAFHGSYRVNGRWLVGRVRAPRPDGKLATSREAGRRTRTSPTAPTEEAAPVIRHAPQLGGRLQVVGRALRDPAGRAVLLRGVNAGKKSAPFLAEHTAAQVRGLVARTGINYVRYYVAWRAIEPEPLLYDASYLASVVEGIKRWTDAGVYVCVDFHQDVWGGPFTAHGAPEWASLGKQSGLELPAGLPWQARYVEPRVYRQFEAFWSNARVPQSGLGVQDHYARAWAQLASRLVGVEGVVGYDPMNEPFFGNEIRGALARTALGTSLTAARAAVSGGARALFGPRKFGEAFGDRLTTALRDPKRFDATIRRFEGAAKRFEPRLAAFYTRVGRAIREVDPGRPLFIEPFALAGIGLPSHLPRPDLDQLVYAPHLYDSFMDSGFPYDGDSRRVARALERHLATAHRLDAPLVIGEWGNLPGDQGAAAYADDVGDLLDRHGVGTAYWDHVPNSATLPWGEIGNGESGDDARLRTSHEERPLFLSAMRPFVSRAAGDLVESNYHEPTRVLRATLRVDAAVRAPTVIAASRHAFPDGVQVSTSGLAAEWDYDAERGLVYVWAGGSGTLKLRIAPKE